MCIIKIIINIDTRYNYFQIKEQFPHFKDNVVYFINKILVITIIFRYYKSHDQGDIRIPAGIQINLCLIN